MLNYFYVLFTQNIKIKKLFLSLNQKCPMIEINLIKRQILVKPYQELKRIID